MMAHICNSISKYRMSCRNWLLAARQNLCSPVPFSTLFNTLFIKIPLNTIINYIIILTQFTSLQHCWGRWHCSQLPSGCSRSRPPRSCSTSHWFMLLWLWRRKWWKLTPDEDGETGTTWSCWANLPRMSRNADSSAHTSACQPDEEQSLFRKSVIFDRVFPSALQVRIRLSFPISISD